MQKNKRNQVPMILFVLLLFAVAAVTLYQPQKVKAAEKEFIGEDGIVLKRGKKKFMKIVVR